MKKDHENKGRPGFSFLTKKEDQVEETPQVEGKGDPESEEEEGAPEDDPKTETHKNLEDVIGGDLSEEEIAKLAQMSEDVASIPGANSLEAEEESEEVKAPAWLELLKEGTSGGDPGKVTDKELLKIKGIGKATLEEIREIYPYQEPKRSGKVMIEVLPMRGIGGVGKAGTQAEMEYEQAEKYVQEGYVKILD